MKLDVLIFGGGGAGLWLLDSLGRAGYSTLLLERDALGTGQTVAAQGIIHGGIKYTLSGLLTESARAIREMPALWKSCLSGHSKPDISDTRVSAAFCHLWRTKSLSSQLGMVGARAGLRSGASKVTQEHLPGVLSCCPGEVFRVDEQVVDTPSLLESLADRHRNRMLKIDSADGLSFDLAGKGRVRTVRLLNPTDDQTLELQPATVVLTAGEGNAELRESMGLDGQLMQRRPLHMVLVKGKLPNLFGHCVDGTKTRATITSSTSTDGLTVWQVGGQIAEDGVTMTETSLIAHAQRELAAVLPGLDISELAWATYRVDRAEAKSPGGSKPAGAQIDQQGNVITAWPTKLALVPELTKLIMDRLDAPTCAASSKLELPPDWPRPRVAMPPWERDRQWHGQS